jgi:hypothetical protein
MNATAHLVIAIIFFYLLVAAIVLLWKKLKLKKSIKLLIALPIFFVCLALIPLSFNIYSYLKLGGEIYYPERSIGTTQQQEDSAKYLEELVFHTEPDPNSFLKAVTAVIKQEELVLPYNRVDLIFIDGYISRDNKTPLPQNFWEANTPIGNLKEQLNLQENLIREELTSNNKQEKNIAIKRIYLLLALSNKYIATTHPMEMSVGTFISGRMTGVLEANPELAQNHFIKSELLKSLELLEGARHAAQYFESVYWAGKFGTNKYVMNKTRLKQYSEIIKSTSELKLQDEKINDLLWECVLTAQIPTYFAIKVLKEANETVAKQDETHRQLITEIRKLLGQN